MFKASGRYFLPGFLEVSSNSKLRNPRIPAANSIFEERDIFREWLLLKYFKSLFLDSCASSDNCRMGKIALATMSAPWINILWTLDGRHINHEFSFTNNFAKRQKALSRYSGNFKMFTKALSINLTKLQSEPSVVGIESSTYATMVSQIPATYRKRLC